MVENEIRSQVATLSAIPTAKISLGRAPRGIVPPYIVVSKLNGDWPYDHDGDDGTSVCSMQVDVYDKDYKTCKEYAEVVKGLTAFTSTNIVKVKLSNEVDLFDATSEVFQTSLEFTVSYYTLYTEPE